MRFHPTPVRVVVATRGRPAEAKMLLDALCAQTRPPDVVVVVGTCAADLSHLGDDVRVPYVPLISARPGLTIQRNVAIDRLRRWFPGEDGITVFFDDDFRPHREWLERCERAFTIDDRIVGLTGRVLADGIGAAEIGESASSGLLASAGPMPDRLRIRRVRSLYGCNMAVRQRTLMGHRFCEDLPLYGWLEDLDFSGQIRAAGDLVEESTCVGVHRGVEAARLDMRQLGYSEIANPLWLRRRRTISKLTCARIVVRRSVAAAVQSVTGPQRGEHRDRFRGVTMAVGDVVRGDLDPMRIADLDRAAPDGRTARPVGVARAAGNP
jgi:hypothetical protein